MFDQATQEKVFRVLNEIMEHELGGVVRYTHYALMITGPNRIPLVDFMKAQADESLLHAQQVGEVLTGLDGHPTMRIAPLEESHQHDIQDILKESYAHETAAVEKYKELLNLVEGKSIYIEEFARGMVGQEELHTMELKKMLRDYS